MNLKELIEAQPPEAWLEPLTRALAGAVRDAVPLGDSYLTIEALAEGARAHLATLPDETLREVYWKLGELVRLRDRALARLEERMAEGEDYERQK